MALDGIDRAQEAFLAVDHKRDKLETALRMLRKEHAAALKRMGTGYRATQVYARRERMITRVEGAISDCEVAMFGCM